MCWGVKVFGTSMRLDHGNQPDFVLANTRVDPESRSQHLLKVLHVVDSLYILSGWWFETFFIFPYIGNNHPNWLIFFRGVETTNQVSTNIHGGHGVNDKIKISDKRWQTISSDIVAVCFGGSSIWSCFGATIYNSRNGVYWWAKWVFKQTMSNLIVLSFRGYLISTINAQFKERRKVVRPLRT